MECQCYLRNVHDKTADGKKAFEKRCGQKFDAPSLPIGTLGEYIPIAVNDKSLIHQFGPTNVERNILGLRATCGWRLFR